MEKSPLLNIKSSKKDILAAFATYTHYLVYGSVEFYSSPAIVSLKKDGFNDTEQLSWMAAIPRLTQLIGGIIGGIFLDYFGRKTAILLGAVPYIIGWVFISAANNWPLIHVGRTFSGIGLGMTLSTVTVYITEVAKRERRGRLVGGTHVITMVSIVLVQVLGLFLEWRWLALALIVLPVISIIAVLPLPESPRWYMIQGKESEAMKSLQWLRGEENEVIHEEFQQIKESLNLKTSKINLSDFKQGNIYKPILLVLSLILCHVFGGTYVVTSYAETLANLSKLNTNFVTGLTIYQTLATAFLLFLSDRWGRRWPLIIAGFISFFGLTTAGICDYLNMIWNVENNEIINGFNVFGLLCLCTGLALAWNTVPYILLSELVLLKVRAFASAAGIVLHAVGAFILVKEFPAMLATLTFPGVIWFYACFMLIGSIIALIFLKETKGVPLEVIENFYK